MLTEASQIWRHNWKSILTSTDSWQWYTIYLPWWVRSKKDSQRIDPRLSWTRLWERVWMEIDLGKAEGYAPNRHWLQVQNAFQTHLIEHEFSFGVPGDRLIMNHFHSRDCLRIDHSILLYLDQIEDQKSRAVISECVRSNPIHQTAVSPHAILITWLKWTVRKYLHDAELKTRPIAKSSL